MVPGRLLADDERLCDLAVRHPEPEQPQHLLLAGGELTGSARWGAGRRAELAQHRRGRIAGPCRAELAEGRVGRPCLLGGEFRALVRERAGELEPCLRHLVRHPELAERGERAAGSLRRCVSP